MKEYNRLKRFALFFVNEKGYFCLNELIKNGKAEQIGFVVTYRQKLVREDYFDKIVSLCSEHGIQYFERKAFNNVKAGELFQEYRIRGCIAIGWQFLLPMEWFKDLEDRLIVFHDSLLPKYRGFAPTPTAILNGEKTLGVTALYGEEGMDTGKIILQEKYEITEGEYIGEIIRRQSKIYSKMLIAIMEMCLSGGITAYEQDESQASYSVWRDLEDCRIDWSQSSEQINRLVHAVAAPYPGAFCYYEGKKIRINRSEVMPDIHFEIRYAGKIWKLIDGMPLVICGNGMLKIIEAESLEGERIIFKKVRSRFE